MSSDIHQQHDAFFKQFYGRPAVAAEFLRHNLPPQVAQAIDFDTLTPGRSSFLGKRSKRYFADLVYECRLKDDKPASIYFLLEHKSAPSPECALQILRYMLMLWEQRTREVPLSEGLPVVIPVVIYHGKRPWSGRPLRELFAVDATFDTYIPAFGMELFDIARTPESEIKGNIAGKAALLLWKALQDEAPARSIARLAHLLLTALGPDSAMETIAQFLYYAQSASADVTWEDLETELAALPQGETIMKSFVVDVAPEAYQKGVLEGMERGIEKGMEKGRMEGMERGMEEGVGYARRLLLRLMYSRFDSVPAGLKEKLDAVRGLSVLESLSDKVLDGASLEAIERSVDKALARK